MSDVHVKNNILSYTVWLAQPPSPFLSQTFRDRVPYSTLRDRKPYTCVLVADDVHKHSWRCVHDHEVPVQFTDLPHIGEHIPSATYASCRNRDYQHAVRNKPMEH